MNPKQASLYFAEYRRGTLDSSTAAGLSQLLKTDAQIRADFQTDTRLEELIGLKRDEAQTPARTGRFDTFLAEFHRRQRSELVKTEPLWNTIPTRIHEAIQNYFVTPASTLVRTSGVAALLAIVVGLSLFYSPNHGAPRTSAQLAPVADSAIANVSVVLANNAAETPVRYILQRVNTSTGEHGLTRFDF